MEAAAVDHYHILGLPSGEEGAKLSLDEIKKAYRAKALTCHPDKCPDDPNAHVAFQKLTTSFNILKDPTGRKAFDDLFRVSLFSSRCDSQIASKRWKMMSDLKSRELAAFAVHPQEKAWQEEERAAKKFQAEVARIREMHAKKKAAVAMMRSTKKSRKSRTAPVVVATKGGAVAASQTLRGPLQDLLNVPLQPGGNHASSVTFEKSAKFEASNMNNLVGAGYQAYEESILEKLKKAAQKQKS